MLLLELIGRRPVLGKDPKPLVLVEKSSELTSFDLETGFREASRSHMKTSPPRPPEAKTLVYNA